MDFVYLIVGDTVSEYDATTPWNVVAFLDEDEANVYCEKANTRAKEIFSITKSEGDGFLWWQDKDNPKYKNEFDNNFMLDETTTFYEVVEIKLYA